MHELVNNRYGKLNRYSGSHFFLGINIYCWSRLNIKKQPFFTYAGNTCLHFFFYLCLSNMRISVYNKLTTIYLMANARKYSWMSYLLTITKNPQRTKVTATSSHPLMINLKNKIQSITTNAHPRKSNPTMYFQKYYLQLKNLHVDGMFMPKNWQHCSKQVSKSVTWRHQIKITFKEQKYKHYEWEGTNFLKGK